MHLKPKIGLLFLLSKSFSFFVWRLKRFNLFSFQTLFYFQTFRCENPHLNCWLGLLQPHVFWERKPIYEQFMFWVPQCGFAGAHVWRLPLEDGLWGRSGHALAKLTSSLSRRSRHEDRSLCCSCQHQPQNICLLLMLQIHRQNKSHSSLYIPLLFVALTSCLRKYFILSYHYHLWSLCLCVNSLWTSSLLL